MKFCCNRFEGAYCIGNHFGINIRMVKFTSPIFLNGDYRLFNISRFEDFLEECLDSVITLLLSRLKFAEVASKGVMLSRKTP